MKNLLLLLTVIFAVNISFATVQHQTASVEKAQQSAKVVKLEKASFSQYVHKLLPKETKTQIGQYAMIGILLVILGALLFIPTLVQIIAATLIIMGVVLFVLDIIGMI